MNTHGLMNLIVLGMNGLFFGAAFLLGGYAAVVVYRQVRNWFRK